MDGKKEEESKKVIVFVEESIKFEDFVREQLYALWRFFALITVALLIASFTLHSNSANDSAQKWFLRFLGFGISNIVFILYHMFWSLFFFYRKLSKEEPTCLSIKCAKLKANIFEWLILWSFIGSLICFFIFLEHCLQLGLPFM